VVLVRHALGLAGDRPAQLLRIAAVGQGHGAEAIAGHVSLHPYLRSGELVAHGGLRVAAELGVPERVVTDLVALARQVLELAAGEVRLVEEIVRSLRPRQHVEGRGVPEARMLAREGLEDADAARGI